MIPEGWSSFCLREVIKLASGDSRPKDVRKEHGSPHHFPVYGGNGVLGYSASNNSTVSDVIIGRVGEYCGVTRFVEGPKWITDNALYAKHVDQSVDREFLALSLQWFDLSKVRSKGGQPLISQEPIYALRFSFPPVAEQLKIVLIARTWDRAIETVEALIANAAVRRDALISSLLDNPEWPLRQLSSLGEFSSAGVDKKTHEDERPVRLLNFVDVLRRDFIEGQSLSHWVTAPYRQIVKCDIRKGDVFFTPSSETRDDIAHSAVAVESIPDAAYSYHVVRLRLNEPWPIDYRAYAFKSPAFLKQARALCAGSGQRYVLSQKQFASIAIRVPPTNEQQRIGGLLRTIDHERDLFTTQLAALRQEKAALMQQLLPGKRRVKLDMAEAA